MCYAVPTESVRANAPNRNLAIGAATNGVKILLRGEGLALLAVATAAYAHAGFSWLLFTALFLAPDLSFLAYFFGPRPGAAAYNLVHSTIVPLALGGFGLAFGAPLAEAIALIALAHIGFDRALGYGLKYSAAFSATHLSGGSS
jgi:hypothetical protein